LPCLKFGRDVGGGRSGTMRGGLPECRKTGQKTGKNLSARQNPRERSGLKKFSRESAEEEKKRGQPPSEGFRVGKGRMGEIDQRGGEVKEKGPGGKSGPEEKPRILFP